MLSALLLAATLGADVRGAIDERLPRWLTTYESLHKTPELSFYEQKTSKVIAERLRALGFVVTERVGRYQNPKLTSYGVVGVMQNGRGPRLLVRADMDALPIVEETDLAYASKVRARDDEGAEVGVMHACGHDVHMTIFLGVAELLAGMKDQWSGTLVMLAQPAEEKGSGARAMLADRLYERFGKPDYALALHVSGEFPAGSVSYRPEHMMANVDSVDVTVRGVGGHGAFPHTTKDPVVLASQLVLALQTLVSRENSPLDPAVITVGSIHGGTKHNIIPNEVKLQLTVRSYGAEVRRRLLDGIARQAKYIALAADVPAERAPLVQVSEDDNTPATYNDPALTMRLVEVWRRELGPDQVRLREPMMGGEDFSRYALGGAVPSVMFFVGTGDPDTLASLAAAGKSPPSSHSSRFAPVPRPTLRGGVHAMLTAALELLRPSP